MSGSGEFSPTTRDLIHERSGRTCERCLNRRAVQVHHRTPRQSGRAHPPWMSAASNGVDLCLHCHGWIESNRAAAEVAGWLVSRGVAEQVGGNSGAPVVDLARRVWLLNDDGTKVRGIA